MIEDTSNLYQKRETLFQNIETALQQYVDIDRALRSIESSSERDASPPIAEMVLAMLYPLVAESTTAFNNTLPNETKTFDTIQSPKKTTIDSCFESEPQATPVVTVLQNEVVETPTPTNHAPTQTPKPQRTISLKIDRYLTLEEEGVIVAGKRISKSRWIIFGLLLAARGGKVPLSVLIRHVPVWAAMLEEQNEPDEGAVKRMLSKMNTLDLRPLGVPYTVKTKKDRKTGVLHVFMDGLKDDPIRGYGHM